MAELEGKAALVTGAGSGIGKAIEEAVAGAVDALTWHYGRLDIVAASTGHE